MKDTCGWPKRLRFYKKYMLKHTNKQIGKAGDKATFA